MLKNYVVIDMEMTGLSPEKDRIMEIGAVKIRDGKMIDTYSKLVNPNVVIREKIVEITGITEKMTKHQPFIHEILQEFMHFIGEDVIVGHNIIFDFSFMIQALFDNGMKKYTNRKWYGIDTLKIARNNMPTEVSKRLDNLCEMYGIIDREHHRAFNDAEVTYRLYEKLCSEYEKDGVVFEPEVLIYNPQKDRKPSKRQLEYLKELLAYHKLTPQYDIYHMTQSEVSRYADKIVLNYGRMKK